nr:putative reverse transcriptase domain-containing protein [Tanacetum cinerariifolium]
MDRDVKQQKQSRIPIVKVCWNSRRGPEFTWEREDQIKKKYLHLFANPAAASKDTIAGGLDLACPIIKIPIQYGINQSTHHLEDEDDVDKWLNAEIKKHMSMQQVKRKKDALISIIKSIRQEMRNGIKKRQFKASTSDEVSSIASNNVDKEDYNTSNTAPYAKDNIMPQKVYEYLGLVKLRDYGMWPTCDPDLKFCFGYDEVFGVNEHGTLRQWICFHDHERRAVKESYMGFTDFIQVHYGQQKIDDNTIGHNNLHESDREFIFNEWILDSYDVKEEYAKEIGNPYSRRFNACNKVFNNEIEMWQSGDEKTDYDPPYVNIKTFKVKKYFVKGGRSFICIIDREDDALPLGRVNGARFKTMIRKELEDSKYVHEMT